MRRRFLPGNQRKLSFAAQLEVRFSEVDSIGMVWHGNYLLYFEVAREAFGHHYGLSYAQFREAQFVAPVVEAQIFYHAPGRLGDKLQIRAHFFWNEAPKLEMLYEIWRLPDQTLLAEGRTLQLLTNFAGELLLTTPPLLRDFYSRWERGEL